MTPFDSLTLPIVAAPMAGGPTTARLVRDVTRAGGWGFLAGANKTVEAVATEVAELQADNIPVGVNLFVPDPPTTDQSGIIAARKRLLPLAERFNTPLGEPAWDDDHYTEKLTWLIEHPVTAVTFTFGLPDASDVQRLHETEALVGITVTNVDDALAAAARGADFLTAQGPEAGGHQSLFSLDDEPNRKPLHELLREIREHVDLPLLASGGIATPDDVREALDCGAVAAQVGTAFLRSSSAGSSATHRAALASADYTSTSLTRAFSGRYARGLHNSFITEFDEGAPAAYPEINRMTMPVRKAAAASGESQWTHLWAGSGWQRTRDAMPEGLIDGDAGAIAQWLAGVRPAAAR